jgi:hypothetical protein
MEEKGDSNNLDDLYEKIDIEELVATELNEEEQKILNMLSLDSSFQVAVEKILANIQDLDIIQIQSQLLLLLHQIFKARIKDKEVLQSFIKKREKAINKNLKNLSLFLMNARSQMIRDVSRSISRPKDKYEYLTKESRNNLRKTIRRFAVYELYKFINPRRIAGETRKENFAHNMVVGGLELASHFEGGTKSEIESYSPTFIKKLDKQHAAFKKGGNKGLLL